MYRSEIAGWLSFVLRVDWETYKASDTHLRTSITELGKRSVEKAVLLPEWLYIGVRMRFRGLECHVRIGDLRDWRAR
jgi:hypothetical protein